ncbi:pyridoxal phosphate-dependent aminotransferase [Actinomadura macra]|uniref:pyridoxal phosphate-dependent aminotransferase n=1 Tax=Actinomadura macra TaxID=46164 RepID=UPI000837A8E9|nr:histidinol-phosphate transaminase [Actinomadura macra]
MVALDGSGADVLWLDWNESPLGPPRAAVRRVVAAAQRLHEYPRHLLEEVTGLAAGRLGVAPSQVLLTSGVDEALDIAMTLVDRGWAVEPGFDFNARVVASGKPFHPIPLGPDWQPVGRHDIGARDAVFLAQPGNPTGNLIEQRWIDEVRAVAGFYFQDETYQEFCSAPSILAGELDANVLVYRSFAKAWGLAGIRVGCLVGDADLIARLAPLRRFMPIDAISLSAAAGVLEEPGFVETLTSHVRRERPALVALLRDSGMFLDVRDTETNFVIARVATGRAEALVAALAGHGIRVKSCDFFGLDDWIRIGVGTAEGHRRLAESLARLRSPSLMGAHE